MGTKVKAYAVTISGSYNNGKREIVDFQNVTGVIPMTASEELAVAAVRNRYAEMWIAADKRYPERIGNVREVFIDSIEETTAEFGFIGKNITDMTYEDLQDLATAKDLRGIPLYKNGSLRESQGRAYAEYGNKVMGMDVDHRAEGFNVMKQPALIVDGHPKANTPKQFTNEEILAQEQASTSTGRPSFSRTELEQMAKEKNIRFNPAIGDDKLYAKIFNAGAATPAA